MGKSLKLSGIIIVIILLGFGFVVGETLTELKNEIASIEGYNDTDLQAKIAELEADLSAVEPNDNTELLTRITQLETALSAIKTNDNTVMFDASGNYVEPYELTQLLINKYFADYIDVTNVSGFVGGYMSINSMSSELSNEEILARIVLILKEISNYNQYLTTEPSFVIVYTYTVGDITYDINIYIPSPVLAYVDFTLDDILNNNLGIINQSAISNPSIGELTDLSFNTVLANELFDRYFSNKTFGDNLLTPSNN